MYPGAPGSKGFQGEAGLPGTKGRRFLFGFIDLCINWDADTSKCVVTILPKIHRPCVHSVATLLDTPCSYLAGLRFAA